jgi:hypothetical protein
VRNKARQPIFVEEGQAIRLKKNSLKKKEK